MRPPLTTETAPQLLMALGMLSPEQLLLGFCRFEDRSSRNRNILVRFRDGKGLFIKSPGEAAQARRSFLEREFRCCKAAMHIRILRRRLPQPRAFHDGLSAAVYALLPRSQDGATAWTQRLLEDDIRARDIGAAIADCHVHLGRALRMADVKDIPELRPGWFDPMIAATRLQPSDSGGQVALNQRLAVDAELAALAGAAKAEWRTQGIVHGDIKLSNLLVTDITRSPCIVIVDWESVSFGDPAWDLAGVIQSCLSQWATGVNGGGLSVHGSISAAERPIQAVLEGYRRRAHLLHDDMKQLIGRAYRFAGVRMLQTAFEQARNDSELYAQTELHLVLARELLRGAVHGVH